MVAAPVEGGLGASEGADAISVGAMVTLGSSVGLGISVTGVSVIGSLVIGASVMGSSVTGTSVTGSSVEGISVTGDSVMGSSVTIGSFSTVISPS